mgnify:CR=1 FL=1
MGLYFKTKVDGLEKLQKHIEFVKKMALLKTNRGFQEYIQIKFLETVNQISMERLPMGDLSSQYIAHNQIKQLELIPGGNNIFLNDNNKLVFIDKVIYLEAIKPYEEQIKFTQKGLFLISSPEVQGVFSVEELNFLLSGQDDIDLKDWKEKQHNGIIYPTFNLHTTVTGRTSCNNPNFQQVHIY